MKTNRNAKNLTARDLITIGMAGAISLVIFFTVGGIAAFTLIGTVANIPIVCFFTAIAYMLLISKVRKPGTLFIMGLINVLPGMMAANFTGVLLSAIGWAAADLFASLNHYREKISVWAYVLGCTLQSALFTLPMYLSGGQYLIERKEMMRLTDETLGQYLGYFIWPVYGINILLTVLTSLAGAVIAVRILKKHFKKAGLI